MTREEVLAVLKDCAEDDDTEGAHYDADQALLKYLGDGEVERAYRAVSKWYS